MLHATRLLLVPLFFSLLAAAPALADKRVALVIGNSDYEHVAHLANPANDAVDIAAALKRLDFSVEQASNVDLADFRKELSDFTDVAENADIALIFFAGHGMEVDKQNYVLPVDAKLETDRRVRFEGVPLDDLAAALEGAKGLRIVLLDACRNNPFAASMKVTNATRSIGRGLSRVEPSVGTIIAFSAKEGTVAEDGNGRNSPYTAALLDHLEVPGLEVQFMFRKVRDDVLSRTAGRQEPFLYGSLPGTALFLRPPSSAQDHGMGQSSASEVWAATKDTTSVAVLRSFMQNFAGTSYAQLARSRVEELEKLAALPDPKEQQDKIAIKPLSGSFFARRKGVTARLLPSDGAAGVTTLEEGKAYRVVGKHLVENGSDAVAWYKLDLGNGEFGFATQSDVFGEKSHEEKLLYDKVIPEISNVYYKAQGQNSGKFSSHFGLYSTTGETCDGNSIVSSKWLVWFVGNDMYLVIMNAPFAVYQDRLSLFRKFAGTKGTMQWYAWGTGYKMAFMGSYIAYEPKFTQKNVNYSVAHKCHNDYAMLELIKSTWNEIVAALPAEKEEPQQ
jgi:uncharacterized caspase-like protein